MKKKQMLAESEAAPLLGVCKKMLMQWRHAGRGPRYVNLALPGERPIIRYPRAAIEEFIEERTVVGVTVKV